MKCPVCEGDMWDNRAKKTNPKAPDFKCKDKSCEGVIWPPKGQTSEQAQQRARNAPGGPPASRNGKDDYWERKLQYDIERGPQIIRQHSQSMALEVLKLKQMLGELTVADLAPAKLRALADYFDNDVLKPEPRPHPPMDINEREPSPEESEWPHDY